MSAIWVIWSCSNVESAKSVQEEGSLKIHLLEIWQRQLAGVKMQNLEYVILDGFTPTSFVGGGNDSK